MKINRAALLATTCLLPMVLEVALRPSLVMAQQAGPPPRPGAPAGRAAPAIRAAPGDRIADIKVEGDRRIEASTILSYMLVRPGDSFDPDAIDRSLKTLYATGLFSDVNIRADGNTLVVTVVENPIVNRIAFEGNRKLSDDTLRADLQLRPRAVFTPELAQSDRQRLLDLYAKRGRFGARVEPKIIKLDENRVDVVFEIYEGDSTLVSKISFVGNHAYGEGTLREVINSREERWWAFLSTSDNYDPDRLNFDKELIRRYYLRGGYADVQITDASAELAADKSAFFVTFTINEGPRYKIAKVSVNSQLRNLDGDSLLPDSELSAGDWYDGDAVDRSATAMSDDAQSRGYQFVDVKPRITRNAEDHTIDLGFDVTEGPRVYIERIDIVGNTRTEDKVLRREFRLAEGDAFNNEALRRSRQRLNDLGYFESVVVQPGPGSTPDRTVVTTRVAEKATGELSLGGGYSTDAGFLINAGIRERNLVGTGIDAALNGTIAQRRASVDFSMTDPYFLDRNLVAGYDIFYIENNLQNTAQYSENRIGFTLSLGYAFNEYLRQNWTYSLIDRDVYNVQTSASIYVQSQTGYSLLSQIGTSFAYDRRDSRIDPHSGYLLRLGLDYAGLGGNVDFARTRVDGQYFIPFDAFTGNSDWGVALTAGTGYLFTLSNYQPIIDNFFLGGDNLRGFESGGVGPHVIPTDAYPSADSVGGHFIWTQSTELHYPLPIPADLGMTGRAFVDVGALSQVSSTYSQGPPPKSTPIYDNPNPRVGIGVGISWRTPFGLINIDVADAVVKYKYDQTQVFRFGFGTRF